MDIGTAKPTAAERQMVPHWGIDIIDPNVSFSIKDFVAYAHHCVSDITQRGKNVLVVGGSGFYLKSFLAPVTDTIPSNPLAEQQVMHLAQTGGTAACWQTLKQLNPEMPPFIDCHNAHQIKKALVRCLSTGLPLSALWEQFQAQPIPYAAFAKKVFCLCPPLEILKWRIRLRTNAMLQNGLLDEVKFLLNAGLLIPDTPAARAIGYRETMAFLQHPTSIAELEQAIVKNTHALVKKQLTWIRHQVKIDRWIF
jgi:tRNA dimethylallyltransferase